MLWRHVENMTMGRSPLHFSLASRKFQLAPAEIMLAHLKVGNFVCELMLSIIPSKPIRRPIIHYTTKPQTSIMTSLTLQHNEITSISISSMDVTSVL